MSDQLVTQITDKELRSKIYTVRDTQVMFDFDLAEIYGVEVRVFNQAVKRNEDRFPKQFRFQLTKEEHESLRSQFVILNDNETGRGKHSKYLPYVFTEQGVAMLSAVLRSETAVKVSIQVMDAFVTMRRIVQNNELFYQQIEKISHQQKQFQFETDKKFEKVFEALGEIETPRQGIFFDGQVFDAYSFVSRLVRKAKISIILIDNYVDDTVLTLLSKRKKGVTAVIYTKTLSKQMQLDLKKHNDQYPPVEIQTLQKSHDRFLILDNKEVYHIGASLKDLGKKWFAFSKMEQGALELLNRIVGE